MVLAETIKLQNQFIQLDGTTKIAVEKSRMRLLIVWVFLMLCFCALALRIINLGFYSKAEAGSKHLQALKAPDYSVKRRDFVDRNGVLLATNLKLASVYANPKLIDIPAETAKQLNAIFPEIPEKTLLDRLSSGKSFVWIKRNISPQEQREVLDLGNPALDFQYEERRTYPHGNLFSHVLGTVGLDGIGLSGLEKGIDGKMKSEKNDSEPIKLSLDVRVQNAMHSALKKRMEMHSAIGAAGVVMDANNGQILGMVSLPDYDPNTSGKISDDQRFNRATLGVFEMGSTFKGFTMAAALDKKLIKLDEMFDATGPIKIGRFAINDFHPEKRWLSGAEVFMLSSNIGTARIADKIGGEVLAEFFGKLGLLSPLETEFPEMGRPLTPPNWSRIATMTASYGHGISVTPFHLAVAVSAMVNGGIYKSPSFFIGSKPKTEKRVMSKETSETMRKLFRLVLNPEHGTGHLAEVKGYFVGGKTGTAEKLTSKRYDANKRLTVFVSAFPMQAPKYVVMTMVDEPKPTKETYGYATAGWIAAPAAHDVILKIAPLLGVEPVPESDIPAVEKELSINYHSASKASGE